MPFFRIFSVLEAPLSISLPVRSSRGERVKSVGSKLTIARRAARLRAALPLSSLQLCWRFLTTPHGWAVLVMKRMVENYHLAEARRNVFGREGWIRRHIRACFWQRPARLERTVENAQEIGAARLKVPHSSKGAWLIARRPNLQTRHSTRSAAPFYTKSFDTKPLTVLPSPRPAALA